MLKPSPMDFREFGEILVFVTLNKSYPIVPVVDRFGGYRMGFVLKDELICTVEEGECS